MKQPLQYFFSMGVLLIVTGSISATYGIRTMAGFLRVSSGNTEISVGHFARGLIVPHIFTFLGMGLAAYGLILLIRGFVFKHQNRPDNA